jgi:Uma2 family endonuclease
MATAALLEDLDIREDGYEVIPQPERPERYEIIHGRIVETPFMSIFAGKVANRLNRKVLHYLDGNDIGDTAVEDMYHIPHPDDEGRNRRPDWSFVSYARWPKDKPIPSHGEGLDVVPDIAAEVVSPTDRAEPLLEKVREYLRGGVRLVWVVYPLAREVHAYLPGANTVRAYLADDDLDAGDVLPGFRTRVGDLFPPVEPTPPPA